MERILLFAVLLLSANGESPSSPVLLQGGSKVTPVEKVIQLLEDLKAEVVADGEAEAKTYDEYACFCKDTTGKKSDSILSGQDNIESLSAEIGAKTAEKEETEAAVQQRKKELEEHEAKLAETKALLEKKAAEYEAAAADLSKAISSLEGAIKALEASKPTAFLLQRAGVEQSLALADALALIDSASMQKVGTFLQAGSAVDPADPEYKFRSQGIIDILEKLLKDYQAHKAELDAEWEKTKSSLEEMIASLEGQIEEDQRFIKEGEEHIQSLIEQIADARESLVEAESLLKDDQAYLKDLTAQCEDRAKDYDQRSAQRAGEIEALTKALEILSGTVQGLDEDVNKRALLQASAVLKPQSSLSFVQVASTEASARVVLGSLLRRAQASAAVSVADARKGQAVEFLGAEGKRLHSAVLMALAARASADPFAKVKELIQKLIERLIREAASEATKKGFCDTEIGKAESDRDFRWADVKKLNSELASLEVKLEELTTEVGMLGDAMTEIDGAYKKSSALRGEIKAENIEDIEKAKEGLAAVKEAILVLKAYYKQAAKAEVLLQYSPVEDDTSGPGFEGAYKGKQQKATGIIGILEVIKSDFERTIKKTTAEEKAQAAEFVEFERASKSDYSGKNMTKTLNSQDIVTTKATIEKKMADLKMNRDLLDEALKVYEELVPACVDTGMTYEERVQAREDEIEALKKALCILDTDGVEPDCGGKK